MSHKKCYVKRETFAHANKIQAEVIGELRTANFALQDKLKEQEIEILGWRNDSKFKALVLENANLASEVERLKDHLRMKSCPYRERAEAAEASLAAAIKERDQARDLEKNIQRQVQIINDLETALSAGLNPESLMELIQSARPFAATDDRTMTEREHRRLRSALDALRSPSSAAVKPSLAWPCVCGDPEADSIHRTEGPCYAKAEPCDSANPCGSKDCPEDAKAEAPEAECPALKGKHSFQADGLCLCGAIAPPAAKQGEKP